MTNREHKTLHTVGPWQIAFPALRSDGSEDNHGYYVISSGPTPQSDSSRDIAYSLVTSQSAFTVSRDDHFECLANAHLIATAPELLTLAQTFRAACVERMSILKDELKEEWCDAEDIDDQIGHWNALFHECNEVIAKTHFTHPKSRLARRKQVSR